MFTFSVALTGYCDLCSRWQTFTGYSQARALQVARTAGWTFRKKRGQPLRCYCPEHKPARRVSGPREFSNAVLDDRIIASRKAMPKDG